MPEEFRRFGDTWRQHHPHWEMRLWTDERLPRLTHPDAFERARNYAERADVLRYDIMWQVGGVYIDTDFECLRAIDALIEGADAFAAYEKPGSVAMGIIGAIPRHPVFKQAVDRVRDTVGIGPFPGSTGPAFFTRVLADFPDVTIFASEKFYPYLWDERHRSGEHFPEAYAVHHWAGGGRRTFSQWVRELAALRGELAYAERRLRSREARLSDIENSAWWRLGQRLSPLLRLSGRLRNKSR
jgi:mannosyltransferase OCH1-like enzyme